MAGIAPASAARWRPELSDEFEGAGLEGITHGVLGRKWRFKDERSLGQLAGQWSVGGGRLRLNANETEVQSPTRAEQRCKN